MAIDPHTHILPEAYLRDVRRGRLGDAVSIERVGGQEWMVLRATIFGKDRETRNILTEPYYLPEPRFKDMERMGVERKDSRASDHLPVVVDVRLRGPRAAGASP